MVRGHMGVLERPPEGWSGRVREELSCFPSLVVAQKGGVLDCGTKRARKLKNGRPASLADHIQNGAHLQQRTTHGNRAERAPGQSVSPARSSRHVTSPLAITVQTCSDTKVIRLGVRRRAPHTYLFTWPDGHGPRGQHIVLRTGAPVPG